MSGFSYGIHDHETVLPDGRDTPCIVAVTNYQPAEEPVREYRGGPVIYPGAPSEVEAELLDVDGDPRPDWESQITMGDWHQMKDAAHAAMEASLDAERREAKEQREADRRSLNTYH